MATPSNLCSTCLGVLQSGLEEVEKTLSKDYIHHTSFASFQEAVVRECFICAKLWHSISDVSLADLLKDPVSWKPLRCTLERRAWAAEWYGAVYWHIRYLIFDIGLRVDLKYAGDVFCLFPGENGKPSLLEGSFHDFEGSTSSEIVHQQAYEWYRACLESHETCRRIGSREKFAPSRLIDVGTEGDDSWKLCLYPQDVTDPPEYLTLSYRWARSPTIVLLSSTIDEFRRGKPIASLPRTFQEAITVARRFSIRYLWIDSLCIIQDSPEDWAQESLRMHQVYANSCCTIAASASDGPDGGLFRSRAAKDALTGYVTINFSDGSRRKFDIWDQFYMNRLTQGSLTGRGWVFQERVLSPRVLHFCSSQIVWECFEMDKCEMFPRWSPYPSEASFERGFKRIDAFFDTGSSRTPFAKEDNKVMSVDVYHQWIHLVRAYSQCALTRKDDRLMAMAGIAELFRKNSGDEHLAGLWKSRLVEGLNWVVIDPAARPQNTSRVPSWSWAAVDSTILPQRTNLPRDDDLVEVIDATVETPQTSAGWRHIRGSIQLRGCVSKVTLSGGSTRNPTAENSVLKLVDVPSRFFAYPDTTDTAFEGGKVLHLLPLRSTLRRGTKADGTEAERLIGRPVIIIEGLIMDPISEAETSYRRVGQFVVDSLEHVSFFGLLAIPPYPSGGSTTVRVDDTRTSLITLV
ncbi:hypothetical protein ACJ41O_012997 [Fusarium nematophilum]